MTSRVNKWLSEERLNEIRMCADRGATPAGIAEHMGISKRTLTRWCEQYPQIAEALEGHKCITDGEKVEQALLRRAIGYTQTEITRQIGKSGKMEIVKTVEKQVMPSTTAQIFWLKNKCGYEWDSSLQDENEEEEGGVVILPEIER